MWTLVPSLFYSGPPGDLPSVIAVGREFQLGTYLGPPLAFWLAELVYDLFGRRLVAVYVLSQVCVVVTFWAVFRSDDAIVGRSMRHSPCCSWSALRPSRCRRPISDRSFWHDAALGDYPAALLAGGGRGPALVSGFRSRSRSGCLLLTTYVGLILVGLLLLFTLVNQRARTSLGSYDPLIAAAVAGLVMSAAPDMGCRFRRRA